MGGLVRYIIDLSYVRHYLGILMVGQPIPELWSTQDKAGFEALKDSFSYSSSRVHFRKLNLSTIALRLLSLVLFMEKLDLLHSWMEIVTITTCLLIMSWLFLEIEETPCNKID